MSSGDVYKKKPLRGASLSRFGRSSGAFSIVLRPPPMPPMPPEGSSHEQTAKTIHRGRRGWQNNMPSRRGRRGPRVSRTRSGSFRAGSRIRQRIGKHAFEASAKTNYVHPCSCCFSHFPFSLCAMANVSQLGREEGTACECAERGREREERGP